MASEDRDEAKRARELSRRRFLRGAGEVAAGGVFAQGLIASCNAPAESAVSVAVEPTVTPVQKAKAGPELLEGEIEIELSINGAKRKVTVEPRTTLLDALRNRLDPALTGSKLVCDRGNCGACTVLVDGEPRYSCLQLAIDVRGKAITTVEGLAKDGRPSALQDAMVAHDGSMCGFCTPGFVVAISACLQKNPRATEDEIRTACSGNACRCGTYPQVFEAALAAGKRLQGG